MVVGHISRSSATDLEHLLAAAKEGYAVHLPRKGLTVLNKSTTGLSFSFPRLPGSLKAFTSETAANEPSTPAGITFVPRSPDAMIYYLGEITRAHLEKRSHNGVEVRLWTSGKKTDSSRTAAVHDTVALFIVEKGRPDGRASVQTVVDNETFWIPESCALDAGCDTRNEHRSMQVIAFVNQVFALQQEAAVPPVIPSFTVLPN